MIKMFRCTALAPLICVLSACAPHFFDGELARIAPSEGLEVTRSEHFYGDCYRLFSRVPVVYRVKRESYTITIVHGMRYWPRLFLSAISPDGAPMGLAGPGIRFTIPLERQYIGRLQERREAVVTHEVRVDRLPEATLRFSVLSSTGVVNGREKFSLLIEPVNCVVTDSL